MKTIRKQFWVKEETFKDLHKCVSWVNSSVTVNSTPDSGNDFMNPIIIEFEVPEKKIELTESAFDKAWEFASALTWLNDKKIN